MSKLCAVFCSIRLKPPALAMNRWDPYFYSPERYTQPVNSTDIFLHYSSFEDLQQSKNRGCPICALFVQDILEHTHWGRFGFEGKIYLRWYRTSVELEAESYSRSQLERTFIPVVRNSTKSCPIQWNRLELLSYSGQDTVEELSTQSVHGASALSYIAGQALPPFNSDETFRTIKDWINACCQYHSPTNCPRHLDEILPTRVIDVASSRDSIISLHVSTNMRGTYVALSHVWGGEISCKLKMKLLKGWTRSIDVNELPRSFQDAITVTRNLGLRYLWIDALCIVQDSPKDWQQESSRMGGIFKNAFLTIAISATAQTQEGFLTRKTTGRTSFMVETPSASGQSCGYEYLRREVSPQGAIDTRGWCLQENALSTRILTFTPDECFFDCRREYVISESGAYSFHDSRYARAGGGLMVTLSKALEEFQQSQILNKTRYTAICEQRAAHWYAMIGGWSNGTCYSSRHLTYSSDRFPALSGLAHEVQRVIQCKYLAGIWECHLLAGLLWTTRQMVKQRQDSSANRNPVPQGNGDPQAPSWSWAASICQVSYPSPVIREYIDGIRIIDPLHQ